MKVLIVDDEEIARMRVSKMVSSCIPEADVVEAVNGSRALRTFGQENPDIVIMDIRMPVMDGLEAAKHLCKLKPPPPIIFLTAYEEHALQAFESHAVDYLLKPVSRERLCESLQRARALNSMQLYEMSQDLERGDRQRQFLCIVTGRNIDLVSVSDILYFRAEEGHVMVGIHGEAGEKTVDESLQALEKEFSEMFVRAHRGSLIGIQHITGMQQTIEGTWELCLRDHDTRFAVSRRHLREVKNIVNKR